jgi:uncharacterized peroxidase-related enzyme
VAGAAAHFPVRELSGRCSSRTVALRSASHSETGSNDLEAAMHEFTMHTAETAPPGSKEPLASLERRIGFIPNLAGTMAASPTLIGGFVRLQEQLQATSLTGLEREVIGLTVSYENACAWSVAAHSTFAKRQGAADEVLDALRSGRELSDARLEALHAFTRKLLRTRGHLDPGDTGALLEAGYTTEHLLEVIAQAAYTSMANWVANVADPPVDEAFQPQVWAVAHHPRPRAARDEDVSANDRGGVG